MNRFLAKSAEKSLPFFKALKKCTKKSDFYWNEETEEAFKQMKQLIAELLMLVAPIKKEELIVYLAAAKETVSAVPMTEREAKQMPIYFVSRALRGSEINYTSMEKLVLALVHANFIVERPEEDSPDTLMEEAEELPEPWILFTNESSCTDGFGEGLILTNPEGIEFTYALRFRFDATNNKAEYEALIAGLKIAEQMGGIDIAGPFPEGPGKVKFLIVAIDYLTKWIEAKRVATITGNQIKKFVWDNIVCRFRLPREIISDNGKQFQDNPFQHWCEKLCICQHFASVKHPQTNGLVERANRSLGEGIKARLDERCKN
ncbi:reverse transcriptase domain-containing protein [Tanacetum coccineum]